ncbi:MAG: aconitase X catalytic domain-containing protein [Candidatus Methanospirareceae archaeon]
MHLTREEERIYEGEEGWTRKKAMEILVAIGDINDASQLIPIESAHISGASYKTIGDAFEFINHLEGRVKVKSTLNPAGMDIESWESMGVSEGFVKKQKEVINAYKRLGVSVECTCIPYLVGNTPERGMHIAWAESSAVLYANSVLGARTNMEGAPSALAAALIGKTPSYGLHHAENREPEVRVSVNCTLTDADYSALGFLIGELVGDKIPLITLPPDSSPKTDELKHLSAAIGATGSVGLYHLEGITPEADAIGSPTERAEIEEDDLRRFYTENEEGDVIAIGCPHCSPSELQEIYKLLRAESKGRKVQKDFFIFTARAIKERMQDVVRKIEDYGVRVICDTCFVVSPAFEHYRCVVTNSGKMLRYVPLLCGGAEARLCRTEECVRLAF